MKALCKILSLVFCLSMLLTFAPTVKGEEEMKGGYVETMISAIPEGYEGAVGPAVSKEGAYTMAAKETASGKWFLFTWNNMEQEPTIIPLAYEGAGMSKLDYSPEGNLLVYCEAYLYDMDISALGAEQFSMESPNVEIGEEISENIEEKENQGEEGEWETSFSDDGATQSFSFGDMQMSTYVFWFSPEGILEERIEIEGTFTIIKALTEKNVAAYNVMTQTLALYDKTGKEIKSLQQDYPYAMAVNEESIYMVCEGKITVLSSETLEEITSFTSSSSYGTKVFITQNTLYLLNTEGLVKVDTQTGEEKEVARFSGMLAGDPTNEIFAFGILADGTVICSIIEGAGNMAGGVVHMGGQQKAKLVAYIYDPMLEIGNKQEFRIVALRDNQVLRKAVSNFQRLHPELDVVLETYFKQHDSEAVIEDALRTINTQLLAGQGGDVIILDELSAQKYINKGLLKDMKGLVEDLGILPNILQGSYGSEGALYAIPTRFAVKTLWGNKKVIEQVSSLKDLATLEPQSNQGVFAPRTPGQLLELLYPASEGDFKDERGQINFESQAFIDFLNTVYGLYTGQPELPASTEENIDIQDIQSIMNSTSLLYPSGFFSLMDTGIAYSLSGAEDSGFMALPSIEGEAKTYTPIQLAGVNSGTKQPDEAIEFVRLLLGEELQALEGGNGLPVTVAALNNLIADMEKMRDDGGVVAFSFGEGNPIMVQQPTAEVWQAVRELCSQSNRPYFADSTLMAFIIEETEAFFAGNITAEQSAQALLQRTWSYLNE